VYDSALHSGPPETAADDLSGGLGEIPEQSPYKEQELKNRSYVVLLRTTFKSYLFP